jgi:hypothetical protein
VATGAAWLKGRNSQGEREVQNILTGKEKKKNILDTHRPSHGRTNPEIKNATASLIVTTKTNEKNRVPELVLELCRPVRQQADGARFRAVGRDYHEALSVRRHIVAGIGEVGQVQLEKRCHGIDMKVRLLA